MLRRLARVEAGTVPGPGPGRLSGTPGSPPDPLRPGTWKCAGSDPPRGRLAVVVANTCPGPKPLPALERSSHPRRFSLPPPGRSSRADLSAHRPGSVTVLRLCTTPRRAPRGAGGRSVEGAAGRRQAGYPPTSVRPGTVLWTTGAGGWISGASHVRAWPAAARRSGLQPLTAPPAPAGPCLAAARP